MRKLFAAIFAMSLAATLLIGGVLAWTSSASISRSVKAGAIKVEIVNTVTSDQKLYPGRGIEALRGSLKNSTPADSGVALFTGASSVVITSPPSQPEKCKTFVHPSSGRPGVTGAIAAAEGGFGGSRLSPGETKDFRVSIAMESNAPNECQGQTFDYTVTFNVNT